MKLIKILKIMVNFGVIIRMFNYLLIGKNEKCEILGVLKLDLLFVL